MTPHRIEGGTMNDHPGVSGAGRRLIRCGIALWGLRGVFDPARPEEAPRHD
jgi:hypothetical protein